MSAEESLLTRSPSFHPSVPPMKNKGGDGQRSRVRHIPEGEGGGGFGQPIVPFRTRDTTLDSEVTRIYIQAFSRCSYYTHKPTDKLNENNEEVSYNPLLQQH